MNIFTLCATIVNILFKYISRYGVTVLEFFLWRNVFNLIAINALVRMQKVDVKQVTKRELIWIVLRALVGNSCFVMINYSLTINSMSIQSILFQTNPFWTSIMAVFLLRESVKLYEYIAMGICFLGVVGIAVSKQQQQSIQTSDQTQVTMTVFSVIIAFSTSWLQAGCNVISRNLKEVHFAKIIFYHPFIGLSLCLLTLLISYISYGFVI